MKTAAITFDLDLADYVGGGMVLDELENAWPVFTGWCKKYPELKTTWFIRIDEHMKDIYGNEDYIFLKHADKINWLKSNGHEIGWHFHSYRKTNGKWKQNADEFDVSAELERVFPFVQKHQLHILRMGWAYHTNVTMKTVSQLGIKLDCSAMPRPAYQWEASLRNWETTPNHPYYPSTEDYRVASSSVYDTLEYPMTIVPLASPYDTESGVLRYINPAYHSEIFLRALEAFNGEQLNTISHPYEFLSSEKPHAMLAFSVTEFEKNIAYLFAENYKLITISDQANSWINP